MRIDAKEAPSVGTELGALHISEELGKLLIGAIVKGAVPHVTINY